MALSSNSKEIRQAKNQPSKNMFYQLTDLSMRGTSNQIATSAPNTSIRQNPKSIADPFASIIAFHDDLESAEPEIRKESDLIMKTLYVMAADADYRGEAVDYVIHKFHPENEFDISCIEHLEGRTGWNQMPDRILEMDINGRACAIFDPIMRMFLPGAGFRDIRVKGESTDTYLKKHPDVRKRYHAFLTNMEQNGIDNHCLTRLLSELGGPLSQTEMALYRGEMKTIPADTVCDYIRTTARGAVPEAVCCMMGENTVPKLLNEPAFINAGSDALIGSGMMRIEQELVVIPPAAYCSTIAGTDYRYAGDGSYLEFSAYLDGQLYHKIYTRPADGWKIFQPQNIIDMFYGVPDGILSRYNYLIQDSAVESLGDMDKGSWKLFPEDLSASQAELESKQNPGQLWTILQRSLPIGQLQLTDNSGQILGTVIPPSPPAFKRANNTMYLSLDPAGAESVLVATLAGSGRITEVPDSDLLYPLTPMSEEDLRNAEQYRTATTRATQLPSASAGQNSSFRREKTHFDSLLQIFFPKKAGGWARLMVESRIYRPNQNELFNALKAYPGTMSAAMTGIGVVSNPKEIIARSNLTPEEKETCMTALKFYIGTLILEGVLKASKNGFSPRSGNLEFLISYPENGSGEGVTKQMKIAIEGALQLANIYLEKGNQLATGENVTLYSESEATAKWHENHPPTNAFLGGNTATLDCGHSTYDYSLRVKQQGNLYIFSLPYAAQNITNATLAKVYAQNPNALMRCFHDGDQELMLGAESAITEAMKSTQGKLYERLGFVLPLNRLFSQCSFQVTGANVDFFQLRVQQMVEAKLNVAIPAYADTVVRAIHAGDIQMSEGIMIAPVGKGSLAINNTGNGYEERFTDRLRAEINAMLGDGIEPYTGKIELLPNNDKDKVSVAEGMIELKEAGNMNRITSQLIPSEDPTEYYLGIIYGDDETAKQEYRRQLQEVSSQAMKKLFHRRKEHLYDLAFEKIMDSYTYDIFEESFNRFGYTGTGDGSFDEEIRETVKEQFENLASELKFSRKALIMACPGIEREMLCGAMVDLALER